MQTQPHDHLDAQLFRKAALVLALPLLALLLTDPALAWDGYDVDTGSNVEIGPGNLVRPGEEIEIYDYDAGEYKDVEVLGIESNSSSVTLEVEDDGEVRTFEMERK